MKPIHKLNNGRGATLCHTCTVIITTGLTKDLYCDKCKPKQKIIMSKEIEVGITVSGVYVTVSGTYHPEEPSQMYDNNMEGYPGSYAEFELESVQVDGTEIIEIISNAIYDEIIEKVIDNQLNQ